MYSVNGNIFDNYMEAIASAKVLNCNVIQVDNGIVRWSPLPPVSAKRMKRYNTQKAAHAAAKRHGLAK